MIRGNSRCFVSLKLASSPFIPFPSCKSAVGIVFTHRFHSLTNKKPTTLFNSSKPYQTTNQISNPYNPLDDNIDWKTYTFDQLGEYQIAEAKKYDPVFDHCIAEELPEPFGIMTWDSSILMANLLETHVYPKRIFERKIVCDLGSGTGLCSLICYSKLGVKKIIALDYNPYSLELLQYSYEQYCKLHKKPVGTSFSFLPITTTTKQHSTTTINTIPLLKDEHFIFQCFDMEQHEIQPFPYCDYVLLSDILYTEKIARASAKRVLEAILYSNANILVTDPGRITAKLFIQELQELSTALLTRGDIAMRWNNDKNKKEQQQVQRKLEILQTINMIPFPSSISQEKNDIKGQYLWLKNEE